MRKQYVKRSLSLLLIASMMISFIPALQKPVQAATNLAGGFEGQDADVFSALGFDTSVKPEGYNAETTDNPYGRDKLPGNQVFELRTETTFESITYGVDNNDVDIMSDNSGLSQSNYNAMGMCAVASGDFNGDGLVGETAYIGYASDDSRYNTESGRELYFVVQNAQDNDTSIFTMVSNQVNPCNTTSDPNARKFQRTHDFAWQNLLQIACGDFDGDGISEVAFYVAENGNARVDIYKYQKTSEADEDAWMNMGNWRRAWSHAISGRNNAVPNMVSLCAGDFNRDGVDDLGISSGSMVLTQKDSSITTHSVEKSTAVVLWGSKTNMLQNYQQLDLDEQNLGEQVRVSLISGDLNGDGTKELIATGQPIYDGKVFSQGSSQLGNMERSIVSFIYDETNGLIAETGTTQKPVDGKYVEAELPEGKTTVQWQSGNGFDDQYFSMPGMRTNAAVFRARGGEAENGLANYLYLDSCLYLCSKGQLTLKVSLDDENYDGNNVLNDTWGVTDQKDRQYYFEYGVVSGDITGQNYDCLATDFYKFSSGAENKNKFHNSVYSLLDSVDGGKLRAKTFDAQINEGKESDELLPVVLSVVDVDMDTVVIEYTGIHYLTYSDPKVLAIIAAAPYFEDVDVISDYDYAWQNTTSYSKINGEGDSDLIAVDLEVGAYIATDKEAFGGKFELETSLNYTLEWEKETTRSTEYELSFETSQNEDAVAFFSIPTENYIYHIYTPDGKGGYQKTDDTVTRTFTPCYQVLTLDYYESIQGNYEELPQIQGAAITSMPGDPASYPSSSSGYDVICQWNDYPAGVSYGNGAITQAITVTKEEAEAYNMGCAWDFQIGGGVGSQSDVGQIEVDTTGGIQWSLNPSGGWSTINLEGVGFEGTVTNMPLEFQDYGYYFSWKLFAYNYKFEDGSSIPVVSYLVNDVSEPPELPKDFQQDFAASTPDKNVLTWTYNDQVRYFHIYKYYEFPEGGGLKKIATIKPGEAKYQIKYDENNVPYKEYYFEDTGLTPYTEYQYAIQIERLNPVPPLSAPSGLLTVRTKAADGYPTVNIYESDGNNNGEILVYPDKNSYLTVDVKGPQGETPANYFSTVQYQWQKMERGAWIDMVNETNKTLTFANAGVNTVGNYRCRVNVQTKDTAALITAYTAQIALIHSKRTAYIDRDTLSVCDVAGNGIELYAKVLNAHSDSAAIPGGTLTFTLLSKATGKTYQYCVELDASGAASSVVETALPAGMYDVYAYYSGSYTFKSCSSNTMYLSEISKGYQIGHSNEVTYGEKDEIQFNSIDKADGVTRITEEKATSFEMHPATKLTMRSLFNARTIGEQGSVTAGQNYVYRDADGNSFYFAATHTGAVQMESGFAVYQIQATDYVKYTNEGGKYYLQENTPADTYFLKMTGDAEVAPGYTEIQVMPRPIVLQLPVQKGTEGTAPALPKIGELEIASGSWAECDLQDGKLKGEIAQTKVDTAYYNTAGVRFSHETVSDFCGYYSITCNNDIKNYNVSYRDGSLTILGAVHTVTLGARPFENQPVGTLYLMTPEYGATRSQTTDAEPFVRQFQTGTSMIFTAVPDVGYEVYDWYINDQAQNNKSNSLAHVLLSEDTKVEVQYAIKQNVLAFDKAGDVRGGTITCDDASITSGSVVLANALFHFHAEAKEGYHFKEWRYTEMGSGTIYNDDDFGKKASDFELIMPAASCSLYAVFERDFCQITYCDDSGNDGLTAWYEESATAEPDAITEKKYIESGTKVKCGTVVTVELKKGCVWDDEYRFVSDGSQGIADYKAGCYTFTAEQDTNVVGVTRRNCYDVTFTFDIRAENGEMPDQLGTEIVYTINDEEQRIAYDQKTPSYTLKDVAGGSTVSARIEYPDYYDLQGWTCSETKLTAGKKVNHLATEVQNGSSVIKNTPYFYHEEEVTYYFTASATGSVSFSGAEVVITASDQVYSIAELNGNETFTVHMTEKPVHTVTLDSIESKGTYTYTLPEGAAETRLGDKTVIKLHDTDDLTVMVTPHQKWTVSYWEVQQENHIPQQYRAVALRYTIPHITGNFTFRPVFAVTSYNTVSWRNISMEQNGIELIPESGYLTNVAAGKDFKFRLSGGGIVMLNQVLTNGKPVLPDQTGVYTISDITQNQVITVTMNPVGILVNDVDISEGFGAGWAYNANSQTLTLKMNQLTLSGKNDSTLAANLKVIAGENAGTLTLKNLTILSETDENVFTVQNPNAIITATGNNEIVSNCKNGKNRVVQTIGNLTIRGNGALKLTHKGENEDSRTLKIGDSLRIVGNPEVIIESAKSLYAAEISHDFIIGTDTGTSEPTVRIEAFYPWFPWHDNDGMYAERMTVFSGSTSIRGSQHAVNTKILKNYGGYLTMEACLGQALHLVGSPNQWQMYYTNGYALRYAEFNPYGGGEYSNFTRLRNEYTGSEYDRLSDSSEWFPTGKNAANCPYLSISPLDGVGDDFKISVTLEDKTYSGKVDNLKGQYYLYVDLSDTENTAIKAITEAELSTPENWRTLPQFQIVAFVTVESGVPNPKFQTYDLIWNKVKLNENTGETGYVGTVGEATFDSCLDYGIEGLDKIDVNTRRYIDARSQCVKSLTLNGVSCSRVLISDIPVYLYGDNILFSSMGSPLEIQGDRLRLYSKDGQGTLILSTGGSGEVDPVLQANEIELHNVSSLTLNTAMDGDLFAPTSPEHKVSISYYYDNMRNDGPIQYGQGWYQDVSGGFSVAMPYRCSEVDTRETGYTKIYAANTDATAEPAMLVYDKVSGVADCTTILTEPVYMGEVHYFDQQKNPETASESGWIELIDSKMVSRILQNDEYVWDGETNELTLEKTMVESLKCGNYIVRVYFYDEDTTDAIHYTCDIPLTIQNAGKSNQNLMIEPAGKILMGRGQNITFTAISSGTVPSAYEWSINGEAVSDANKNSYTMTVPEYAEIGDEIQVKVISYADQEKTTPMASAVGTVVVTKSASEIAISCENETPSGDESYMLYHNTPDQTVKTWNFDALVKMDDTSTDSHVTWSLWGARKHQTTVDAASGELTIDPKETGMDGILKLIAKFDNPDGTALEKSIVIHLSTDAYVTYSNEESKNGSIVGAVYGDSQIAINSSGTWIEEKNVVVVTAQPKDGYAVEKWFVNGVCIADDPKYTIDSEQNTLSFTAEKMTQYRITVSYINDSSYMVSYEAGENGRLHASCREENIPSGNSVLKFSDVVFTAEPDQDFQIAHWTVDGEIYEKTPGTVYTGRELVLSQIEASHSVAVCFAGKEIQVAFVVAPDDSNLLLGSATLLVNGEKVTLDETQNADHSVRYAGTVHAMDDVVILANPDPGYLVNSWYLKNSNGAYEPVDEGSQKSMYICENIKENLDVKLDFRPTPTYEVTACTNSYQNGSGILLSNLVEIPMSDRHVFQVKQHDSITFMASPDLGCYFYGWEITGAEYEESGNTVTLKNVTENASVNATFRRNYYDVALVTDGNGSLTANYSLVIGNDSLNGAITEATPIPGGCDLNLTACPGTDSILRELKINGKAVLPQWDDAQHAYTYSTDAITENTEIYASFTDAPDRFGISVQNGFQTEDNGNGAVPCGSARVSFIPDGISGDEKPDDNTAEIAMGGTAKLIFTPEEGYMVDYAALESSLNRVISNAASKASVKLSIEGKSCIAQICNVDQQLKFTELVNPFVLQTGEDCTIQLSSTGEGKLTAFYGTVQLENGCKLPAGSEITLCAESKAHYAVNALKHNGIELIENACDSTVTRSIVVTELDTSISADFAISEYQVTVLTDGHGGAYLNDQLYESGNYYLPANCELAVAFKPDINYKISSTHIAGGQSTDPEGVVYTLTGDMTIQAAFTHTKSCVNFEQPANGQIKIMNGAGEIITNGSSVETGSSLVIIPTPDSHYRLASLEVAGCTHDPASSYIVGSVEDILIQCSFEISEVPVTFSGKNGTVSVSCMPDGNSVLNGAYVPVGSQLKITESPAPNCKLEHLTVTGAQKENNGWYDVGTEPVNILAEFSNSNSNPSNPTDPTDPSKPSNPTDPTDPSKPSNPTDPTNPSKPSNPTDPSDPVGPSMPEGEYTIVIRIKGDGNVTVRSKDGMVKNGDAVKIGTVLTICAAADPAMSMERLSVNGVDFTSGNEYRVYANTEITAVFTQRDGIPYYLTAQGKKQFVGFSYDLNRDGYISDYEYIAPDHANIHFSSNQRFFRDISGHWGEKDINFITQREIFMGVEPDLFAPDMALTRAMFITVIGRMYESSYGEIQPSAQHIFTDCNYSDYYGKYVDWGASKGIIAGYGDGIFDPDGFITREQMALIIYQFVQILDCVPDHFDQTLRYTDSNSISEWAHQAAAFCQETGIILGKGEGVFAPQDYATRAETAAILKRVMIYTLEHHFPNSRIYFH